MGISRGTLFGWTLGRVAAALFVLLFGTVSASRAVEVSRIAPAAVAACSEESESHPLVLAIDSNPETYTCMRDSSPNGTNESTK
ncbi:MAG: hypothetical protein IKE64_07005, partial [Thermoguttaceae bacterium]|nr:hypothetical protein [Thermoguttaceae bacterium]